MDTKKKIPLLNKIAYGLGTGGGNIFNQIASAFLLQYYTDTVFIGAGAIATMFLICRVFDGISDFVMGAVIDKTSTKFGKARPWLLLSAPLMMLGIILLMRVPTGWEEGAKLAYAYATYIFMNVIVYTIYGIANTAMIPLMTTNAREHTMLATFASVGNNLIGLIAGSLITPLVLNLGWHTSSIILGAICCGLILFSALLNVEANIVKREDENKKANTLPMSQQLPAVLKNKYFYLLLLIGSFTLIMNANAIGAQIYYCNLVLRDPQFMSVLMLAGQLPGVLIMFFMPAVANKYSKQTFLILGGVLLIIGFFIVGIAGSNTVLITIGTVIRGLGAGPMFGAIYALIPDVVDYGYWKYGVRSEGLISSAQSIGSKVGIGIGSALTGWILAAVGYDATLAVQSDAVVNAIRFDFSWLGMIISAVLLVVVLMTNVEKYADQYRQKV